MSLLPIAPTKDSGPNTITPAVAVIVVPVVTIAVTITVIVVLIAGVGVYCRKRKNHGLYDARVRVHGMTCLCVYCRLYKIFDTNICSFMWL